MANPVGRPIEYNDSFLVMAEKYLELSKDEEYNRLKSKSKDGESYENFIRVKLPTIEGLAVYLKISRETVYAWKEKYPEFSDIVKKLLVEQCDRLISNGLNGTYNASIAKLLLVKHQYVDRQELTGKDGDNLLPKPLLDGIRDHDSSKENPKAEQAA